MEINRAAFGALAIVGVVAAGGGAYLATRPNQTDMLQAAPMYAVPAGGVVTETENAISSTPPAAVETAPQALAPEPVPAPAPAPLPPLAKVRRRAPAALQAY